MHKPNSPKPSSWSRWLSQYDLTWRTALILAFLVAFFGLFLVYPIAYVLREAFFLGGDFNIGFFRLDEQERVEIWNSTLLALITTITTTIVSLPLAYVLIRYSFPGKSLLQGFVLVPMIMPPFVGAVGIKQLFSTFGSVNMLMIKLGIMDWDTTIDWFGGSELRKLGGVVFLGTLHLYPIMYLNVAAALANVDPTLEDAARNMGAGRWKLFRTISLPLMMPGYFAGAIIVFIWAFTDLGTPLMFEFRDVVAVRIFESSRELATSQSAYALVVIVIVLTAGFFYLAKRISGSRRYEMMARGHTGSLEVPARGGQLAIVYGTVLSITLLAILPHISVILTSVAEAGTWSGGIYETVQWKGSILPHEFTGEHFGQVFVTRSGEQSLTSEGFQSIKNSFKYSVASTLIDIVLGVTLAWMLTRRRIPWKNLLDATAMMPLALPGVVMAFGYVGSFGIGPFTEGRMFGFMNPRVNPMWLLIIAYAVRRLPYMMRSAYAGFEQTSVTLEEASYNLGASPSRTLMKITLPLVTANLIAGAILAFSFAMLEVSDSLILAGLKSGYDPITKVIYEFSTRLSDGQYVASAMGVLAMILLTCSLLVAAKVLGRRMGDLFRA
ncbi:iron ABC transporter permease [Candidatus Poribacteria bacterium]|jgi:iron(III) transport system permease protein|nr:iron ABC transporter permease [Candidatus Poribacteria bacterium]MBT5709722.1 iron ABC transporter permease [Candidatus Poribacteria bacterium]MBT7805840.1 iron ABC transporter permease [Candidatus Poribacteria bacterium]